MTKTMEQMIDELQQKLNELKKLVVREETQQDGERKGYHMDVLTEAPEYGKLFWYVDSTGSVNCNYYCDECLGRKCYGIELFNWSPTFTDKESAETYKEFMTDVKRLSRAFRFPNTINSYFVINHDNMEVTLYTSDIYEGHNSYFNPPDAVWLLNKYGTEVIKNWILYCK